ncbi:MAG: helix-turn-helix transcriptional regulator [Deltaproteobacteria bacterium]|nr:helix-turn-helix transcriptional regulator [Deltaproteobacteria bacterium]
MSLKYVVLGLLASSPLHGYAVRAALEQRIGDFVELGCAQIYAILAALEEEGLAAATIDHVGKRRRRVYALTETGTRALREWILAAPREGDRRRDLFLRLLVAGADHRLVGEILRAHARHETTALARLRAARSTRAEQADLVRRLRIEAEIRHAEAALEVIALCRSAFERPRASGMRVAATAGCRASAAGNEGSPPGRRGRSPRASRTCLPSSRRAS